MPRSVPPEPMTAELEELVVVSFDFAKRPKEKNACGPCNFATNEEYLVTDLTGP